jgi:MAF protein
VSSFEPRKHLIILASSSPRRQELLKVMGISFVVVPPVTPSGKKVNQRQMEVDETPLSGESPSALVQRLSRLKAESVVTNSELLASARLPTTNEQENHNIFIIAADTVVVLGKQILGKPRQAAEAIFMLQQLRRQSHNVYTGLTVARLSGKTRNFITRLHQSTVWMRPYTDSEIAAYVTSGDPLDKAGAYGIQNRSFAPVARLEGCFASVMGLPLGELNVAFKELGLSLPESTSRCSLSTGHPCCQYNS